MAEVRVGRRLAAILAADVCGYSQLMSADEAGTLAALQTHRSELITPAIQQHSGRIVKLMGDGRFPLLGMSQGCAISVAFAVRHPERVTHLVLYGGFARGAYRRAKNEFELQKAKALATLIRTGWGEETPVFRQLFSSLFMPGGTQEQLQKFAERQRKTTSAECAYRYFETTRNLDVTDLLPKVTVPTLVMHMREDQVQPFDAGRELAAGIPGARFVALQGQNHIPLQQDPETERILEEIKLFLQKK